MQLRFCNEGHEHATDEGIFPCVQYVCLVDGEESWVSHIPDDRHLLTRLNGSYDTVDLRDSTVLQAADYSVAVTEEEQQGASPKKWWQVWRRA